MLGTIIFLLISLVSIIKDLTDPEIRKCIKLHRQIALVIILYSFLVVFLLFGWILSPPWAVKLHLVLVVGTVLYLLLSECLIKRSQNVTSWVNRTCDLNKKESFNFIERILKRSNTEWLFYVLGVLVSIWRIKHPESTLNLRVLLLIAILIPFVPPF